MVTHELHNFIIHFLNYNHLQMFKRPSTPIPSFNNEHDTTALTGNQLSNERHPLIFNKMVEDHNALPLEGIQGLGTHNSPYILNPRKSSEEKEDFNLEQFIQDVDHFTIPDEHKGRCKECYELLDACDCQRWKERQSKLNALFNSNLLFNGMPGWNGSEELHSQPSTPEPSTPLCETDVDSYTEPWAKPCISYNGYCNCSFHDRTWEDNKRKRNQQCCICTNCTM